MHPITQVPPLSGAPSAKDILAIIVTFITNQSCKLLKQSNFGKEGYKLKQLLKMNSISITGW